MRTIVQVPMAPELKKSAEKAALESGFSSLQEIIRVFLRQFAKKEITLSMQSINDEPPLSAKARRRYHRMLQEIRQGKGIVRADTRDEFLSLLRS